MCFLDESGIDHRLFKPFARAPRGEKVYADVPGAKTSRTSVISASIGGRLVCPMIFEGHCNRELVDAYLAKMLLPRLPAGCVIVLDNASFHKSPSTSGIVEAAGCSLMFLPPYSPDLNPIENTWALMKKMLRNGLQETTNKKTFIGNVCVSLCL